jgi:aspartyl aminopeptidase
VFISLWRKKPALFCRRRRTLITSWQRRRYVFLDSDTRCAQQTPHILVSPALPLLESITQAKLEAAGFARIWAKNSSSKSQLQPGGKYYYTVHQSTFVAFTVGAKFQPSTSGFHIIGGHTDSPNLKVKPRSKKAAKSGCLQLGVECYGGGLWHTWFDRDLSISGKVLVRKEDGKLSNQLVQLTDPVARVSTLCIHLQSGEERKAFAVNKEDHTSPIIATAAFSPNAELEQGAAAQLNGDAWQKGHEPMLLQKIAEKMGVSPTQIADWDLSFYDTQGAAIGGMNQEFLYSARLDNLATVFCATEALTSHDPASDTDIAMIVCFDHEEVGSVSSHGAGSPVLAEAMRRISAAVGVEDASDMIARSFCLSIDQAHAIHPNYASKHDSQHAPTLNSGIVIKTNSNQRYATNSFTGFVVVRSRTAERRCDCKLALFVESNLFVSFGSAKLDE